MSKMSLHRYLAPINEHNFRTLQRFPLAELSGALGDLGTLLPLMVCSLIKDVNLRDVYSTI